MEKIITYETLRNFAYSGDKLCMSKGPIRGIVFEFFGLGGRDMFSDDPVRAVRLAERDIALVIPYYNPWSWMNRQTVSYTDEIADVLFAHCGLPDNLPVVSTGGSMGGLSALIYTRYSKRTPVACVANCPVCDLPYHYTERPDLPRTLYSAFFHEEGTMEDAMRANSPLHLVDSMPDSDYCIFHCDADMAVNKEMHSDRLVRELGKSHRVNYHVVPGRGHCDLTPEMWEKYEEHIFGAIEKAYI